MEFAERCVMFSKALRMSWTRNRHKPRCKSPPRPLCLPPPPPLPPLRSTRSSCPHVMPAARSSCPPVVAAVLGGSDGGRNSWACPTACVMTFSRLPPQVSIPPSLPQPPLPLRSARLLCPRVVPNTVMPTVVGQRERERERNRNPHPSPQ